MFPDRFWQFENKNHTPTDMQKSMFAHWNYCAGEVARMRKGKRLVVVHDGDAIDGWHHSTTQVVTMLENEQIEIHCELMDFFLKKVGGADELYYIKGTEIHTNSAENRIGKDLDANQCGELYAWDELRLPVNGRELWFVHHGPTAGRGANLGNSLRNWLRNQYFDQIADGNRPPDYIITGHTHKPMWTDYIGRIDGHYHWLQGLICPSWQQRTRYGHMRSPMQRSKIGLQYFTVTRDGHIQAPPVELLMR